MVADFGSVSVNTTPSGATVTVDDGADTCYRTPCSFPRMGTGLHALTIEKDGYAREAKNVDVTRGGQQAVNVTLREKLGTLTVFAKYTDGTDCEGDIYIDGQRQPEPTPFMGQVLATSHLVEVRCPGAAPVSENITVEHNRTVTRTISTCQPECSGKNCGPDGCGGDCGTCRSGTRCLDGLCRQIAPAPRPQPVETRPAAPATRPQTIGSGSGGTSGQSGRAQGGKTGGSGLTLTWETLGVGYLGSINQLWNAVTVTPVELGFKAFKGLLFAGFLDWQILIPWSGISAGFLNALHIGARLGYEFLNIGDNTFAMFADAKLAWEYNFSFGDDQTDAFGTHAMLAGARVGLRITFVKLAVTFDYSTLNGAGAGFSFSIGN